MHRLKLSYMKVKKKKKKAEEKDIHITFRWIFGENTF